VVAVVLLDIQVLEEWAEQFLAVRVQVVQTVVVAEVLVVLLVLLATLVLVAEVE
jgi:hypothetical protein